MTKNNDACETIRPSSSSLTRAPSWSLGVGADSEELDVESNQADDSSEFVTFYPKLDLRIPTVYLTKKDSSSSSYHVYQLTIKTSTGEEWSVYRRYSQFYELHQKLKNKDPVVAKFHFPPKRRLNSKASTIVQERRRKLEEYVSTLNCYIEKLPPSLSGSGSLQQLQDIILCSSPTESRVKSPCETNSLSDSANSEPTCSGDQLEQAEIAGSPEVMFPTSSRQTSYSEQEQNSLTNKEEKASIRSLFHKFISLQDKKDEQFDPSSFN